MMPFNSEEMVNVQVSQSLEIPESYRQSAIDAIRPQIPMKSKLNIDKNC